MKEEISFDKLM